MPNTSSDVVTSGARAQFGGVAANDLVPLVGFNVPDTFGKEASGNEVKKTGRNEEKVLDRRDVASSGAQSVV